jgi:hypothetical protein
MAWNCEPFGVVKFDGFQHAHVTVSVIDERTLEVYVTPKAGHRSSFLLNVPVGAVNITRLRIEEEGT